MFSVLRQWQHDYAATTLLISPEDAYGLKKLVIEILLGERAMMDRKRPSATLEVLCDVLSTPVGPARPT